MLVWKRIFYYDVTAFALYLKYLCLCMKLFLVSGFQTKQCRLSIRATSSLSSLGIESLARMLHMVSLLFISSLCLKQCWSHIFVGFNNLSYSSSNRFWLTIQDPQQCFHLYTQRFWKCFAYGACWILMRKYLFLTTFKVFPEATTSTKVRNRIEHTLWHHKPY